jgi:hypothetical protein
MTSRKGEQNCRTPQYDKIVDTLSESLGITNKRPSRVSPKIIDVGTPQPAAIFSSK